jgi:uncharacterized membrane protein YphA (DoxX/SURF4 family)
MGTATTVAAHRASDGKSLRHPQYQAFLLLRIGFAVAPILFGLDKYFNLLTDWERYLSPAVASVFPGTPHQLMLVVGATEIAAGLLVAIRPRIGAYVVAAWLAGIIVNLLLLGGFYDIALRDFGLMLGALTLGRLAAVFDEPRDVANYPWDGEL